MGGLGTTGDMDIYPHLPHNSLISLNSILAVDLLGIDASYRQTDVCQEAVRAVGCLELSNETAILLATGRGI